MLGKSYYLKRFRHHEEDLKQREFKMEKLRKDAEAIAAKINDRLFEFMCGFRNNENSVPHTECNRWKY